MGIDVRGNNSGKALKKGLRVVCVSRQHEQFAGVQEGGFVVGLNREHRLVLGEGVGAMSFVEVNLAEQQVRLPGFRVGGCGLQLRNGVVGAVEGYEELPVPEVTCCGYRWYRQSTLQCVTGRLIVAGCGVEIVEIIICRILCGQPAYEVIQRSDRISGLGHGFLEMGKRQVRFG